MRLKRSKVAIVNSTPFCSNEGINYLAPSELTSLSQWFSLFGETILLKPQVLTPAPPQGWKVIPSNIRVVSLCSTHNSRLHRKKSTIAVASRVLGEIDLLYARMPNYEGLWVFRIAKRMQIPMLLELHGDWESAVMEEDCQDLIHRMTRRFRARHADNAIRRMSNYASAIVAIGPRLEQKYVPPTKPFLVSTNHLLPGSYYCPRSDFNLKSPPQLLFVGDIQRRKGLLVLFSALRTMWASGHPFQMVLVGDGPLEPELRTFARREGFSAQVTFAGRISHGPELLKRFREADVFILPSIAAEGVPRVIHEAMALGCPVVASDVGSVAWQLEGGAGVIVRPGDANALAHAVMTVIEDESLRCGLSERGYRRALDFTIEHQKFTIEQFVTKTLDKKLTPEG